MKKILVTFAGVAGLAFSMNASATAIAGVTGGATTAVSTAQCTLLTEAVNINTSSDVAAAYVCNTTTNIVAVGTCHPNGRKPDNTNNYMYVGSSAGGSIASATPDAVCDSAGSAINTKATTEASGS